MLITTTVDVKKRKTRNNDEWRAERGGALRVTCGIHSMYYKIL